MLHSNFEKKTLTRVIGGTFYAHTIIMPFPILSDHFLQIYVYLFWMLYSQEQNKNTSEFPQIVEPQTNSGCSRQAHSSGSIRVK